MPRKKPTFSDLINPPKTRWPIRGDRLFIPATDLTSEAEVHGCPAARQVFMMDGYKLAGDLLVDEAISDRIAKHHLIYPIVFCYRQFLELSLKWQINTYGSICGLSAPPNNHDLKKLIRDFRKMNLSYGAPDVEAIAALTKCILEFYRMDPGSFTFRYAVDQTGRLYPVTTNRIDLRRLKDVIEGIQSYFRGCDGYFDSIATA